MAPDKIIFGSMRMLEYDFPAAYWVNLFSDLHDLGVRTWHSSSEYESFELFCEVVGKFGKTFPDKPIRHMVKLAEPHFHVNTFDAGLLSQKVDEYLDKLQTDSLYCVQWMWRGDLSDNERRKALFLESYPAIEKAVAALKQSGKIENFHCFPYDAGFAQAALNTKAIDGLVVYRNKLETEYDGLLQQAARAGKRSFIIRPLFGGKALELESETPRSLLRFALDMPNVDGAVLSISSIEKITQIL